MKEKYYVVAKSISKWKNDNWFENWLGCQADKSELWKRIYLLYYKLSNVEYFKKGLFLSDSTFNRYVILSDIADSIEHDREYIRRDMMYCLHRFGVSFEEYFIYHFYDKNTRGRQRYDTLKMHYGYCELVNGKEVRNLFEDKGACYNLFKKFYKRDLLVVYNRGGTKIF